jgi:hypothetical protein
MNDVCKICGNKTKELYDKRMKTLYYRCNHCEFVSKDETDYITQEHELKIYKNHKNSIDDKKYVSYLKKFIDSALIPFIGQAKYGLDYGSGPEPVLSQILDQDYGLQVDIYDKFFSTEEVFTGKEYDFITSTEVIEHIADPVETFQLLKNHLNHNGVLAMMTLFHPLNDELFVKWHYNRDRSHISFFSGKTFEYLAEILDLKLIYIDSHRCVTLMKP